MVTKAMAAILTVLGEIKEPIHRTKLVKLIYMADNLYYEHFGKTITGFAYMWDDHGPNAVSNAVVKETDRLLDADFVCMKEGTSMYGSPNYLYSLGHKKAEIGGLLSPLEVEVLRDTVARYGGYSVSSIVSASKKTKPFKDAQQYHVLKMKRSQAYVELIEAIKNDPQSMVAIKEALGAGEKAEGVWLKEAKQKYGS